MVLGLNRILSGSEYFDHRRDNSRQITQTVMCIFISWPSCWFDHCRQIDQFSIAFVCYNMTNRLHIQLRRARDNIHWTNISYRCHIMSVVKSTKAYFGCIIDESRIAHNAIAYVHRNWLDRNTIEFIEFNCNSNYPIYFDFTSVIIFNKQYVCNHTTGKRKRHARNKTDARRNWKPAPIRSQ